MEPGICRESGLRAKIFDNVLPDLQKYCSHKDWTKDSKLLQRDIIEEFGSFLEEERDLTHILEAHLVFIKEIVKSKGFVVNFCVVPLYKLHCLR